MAKSTASQAARSAPIFTLRCTRPPRIRGRWLQTTRLPTIPSWQWPWATTFTRAAATLAQTKPGATTQVRTHGTMLRSPICLRAVRLPPPAHIMAGGYLPEATSTSPSAPARLPGTPLPTPGRILQTWCRPAISSQAQLRANLSTPLPATLPPSIVPTITSSILKPPAAHQHQLLRRLQLQRSLLARPRRQPLHPHPHPHLRPLSHRHQLQHLLLQQPRRRRRLRLPLPRRQLQLHLLRHRDLHRRRELRQRLG